MRGASPGNDFSTSLSCTKLSVTGRDRASPDAALRIWSVINFFSFFFWVLVYRYQFEIQFAKVLVEELKFHFHDCFMAKEDQIRKSRASKGLDKCPPCGECGKEFFQDVKNGQVRFDVLQSNLLDTFNPKLLDVSARRQSVCGNTHFCRQSVHRTRGTCLRPTDTYPPSPLVSVHLHF